MSTFRLRASFFVSILFLSFSVLAQTKLTFNIDNYNSDTLVLAYQYGDKQYVQDSIFTDTPSKFTYQSDSTLEPGIYLVVINENEEMNYFQILIDDEDKDVRFSTNKENLIEDMKVEGSENNRKFFDYLRFLNHQRPVAMEINEKIQSATEEEKAALIEQQKNINTTVLNYQKNIINSHPESLVSAIIKSNLDIDAPEFVGEDAQKDRYLYFKKHWFDNVPLGDRRLLRTDIIQKKLDYYLDKMVVPHPDSINMETEAILDNLDEKGQPFKYYLIHFLNKYAKSKYIGMDAVYVNLVQKYYAQGKAPWTDEEQLKKIIDNANTLEPLLIGKIAPDINLKIIDVEGTLALKDEESEHKRFAFKGEKNLHSLNKKYNILFIWAPDCGHCKKSMPKMIEFYEKYQDKVEIFAVCNKFYDKIPECAKFIKENIPVNWFNVADPYLKSKYQQIYDVKSTPQIYILDDKHEIVSKKIGVEQLGDIIDSLEKEKQ